MRILSIVFALFALVLLSACATSNPDHERSSAVRPVGGFGQPVLVVAPLKPVQDVMQCMADSGRFKGHNFGQAAWIDSTNKANYNGSGGATGAYLPGAATTLFTTDSIQRMGGTTSDFTDLVTETNFRSLLTPVGKAYAEKMLTSNVPDHFVEGKWLSLDFSSLADVDAQFNGAGPVFTNTGATVVAQVNITDGATRKNVASSTLSRTVFSTKLGISFGRYLPWGKTLATGQAIFGNQQKLQMESSEYLVELGFADAITKMPGTPRACRLMVENILGPPVSEAPYRVASN